MSLQSVLHTAFPRVFSPDNSFQPDAGAKPLVHDDVTKAAATEPYKFFSELLGDSERVLLRMPDGASARVRRIAEGMLHSYYVPAGAENNDALHLGFTFLDPADKRSGSSGTVYMWLGRPGTSGSRMVDILTSGYEVGRIEAQTVCENSRAAESLSGDFEGAAKVPNVAMADPELKVAQLPALPEEGQIAAA